MSSLKLYFQRALTTVIQNIDRQVIKPENLFNPVFDTKCSL